MSTTATVATTDDDDLIPNKRVAKMLGVSLSHVAALQDSGKLPCIRVGRRRCVEPAQVRAFVARNRYGPDLTEGLA